MHVNRVYSEKFDEAQENSSKPILSGTQETKPPVDR